MSKKFDLIVLGSGPGGYVTAIRASQLGLKTAIVEKESLGGVCLNWGCIPTKALLKSAQVFEYIKKADAYGLKIKDFDKDFNAVVKRSRDVASGMSKGVNFLMKKNKIEVINGYGKIKPNKVVSVENEGAELDFEADNIIIATGGRSRVIDSIPQDGKKIIGYREAMTLQKQPKKMIIVGSGAIGIEFAYFYNSMGTEVKIIEYMDRILPVEDKDISNQLNKTFKKSGIEILTNSEVISSDTKGKGVKVQVKSNGQISDHEADIVLSAVGYKSNIDSLAFCIR
jgi:dihydrolipoamide dehydrogenase